MIKSHLSTHIEINARSTNEFALVSVAFCSEIEGDNHCVSDYSRWKNAKYTIIWKSERLVYRKIWTNKKRSQKEENKIDKMLLFVVSVLWFINTHRFFKHFLRKYSFQYAYTYTRQWRVAIIVRLYCLGHLFKEINSSIILENRTLSHYYIIILQ